MELAQTADRERQVIGERALLHRRRHHRLSQRALSMQLGWGANRVSQVERAEVDLSITELYDLAEALGCTVAYLLGITDEFVPPTAGTVTVQERNPVADLRFPTSSIAPVADFGLSPLAKVA